MENVKNRVLAQVLNAIMSSGLPVEFCPRPDDARSGDVRFRITLPKTILTRLRLCHEEFNARHISNFLGEWFVRTNLAAFEHHVCANIAPGGWGVSLHKSFGMSMRGETIEFAFHVSLLSTFADPKPAPATGPVQAGPGSACSKGPPASGGASGSADQFKQWLAGIPLMRPREMYDRLAAEGYVGQDAARVAVCLTAYRHVKRLRMIHIDGVARSALPPKENVLLLGPTGCGKTFLVELLFGRILGLPTIIADMTSFTETGYIGDSVGSLFPRLVQAAGGDARKAAVGIICLDEFDKLAGSGSRARFAGQGTTKDVSGYGVQRELLKMLEKVDLHEGDDADRAGATMSTVDLPFIACGAFSGFKAAIRNMRHDPSIGFGTIPGRPAVGSSFTESVADEEVVPAANFAEYGMLPELIGRFGRIIPLQPMGVLELQQILSTQVVERYRAELTAEGVRLEIAPPVLERLAERCLLMQTGARGIAATLSGHLERACFDVYSSQTAAGSVIRIKCDGDRIVTEVAAGPATRPAHLLATGA
jgi:ATP-dependent Clp protease ATP-binding subunit ClpX